MPLKRILRYGARIAPSCLLTGLVALAVLPAPVIAGETDPHAAIREHTGRMLVGRRPLPAPPVSDGYPDETNTGVPDGVQLTPSGAVNVTTPGTVIDGLDISGGLVVSANNVTIRRSRIRHNNTWVVYIPPGVTGTIIEDAEIDGLNQADAALAGWNYTARRVDIHGAYDGAKIASGVTIEDSYIHDLCTSAGAHNDGVQAEQGTNMTLRHNTIVNQQTQTSAILIAPDSGPIDNMTIQDNFLDGGGYTVYTFGSNITVTNNAFGRNGYYGPVHPQSEGNWTGNFWADTGAPLEY